jgi:hypothetical protein
MSQDKHQQAVDLMIEMIFRHYPFLKNQATKQGCNSQLDRVQEQLLDFLHKMR